MPDPLFRKIDCIRLPVPDLDAALDFYRDKLGHELVWRSERAAGLRFPDGEGEIVLHTEGHPPEVDLQVGSADEAAQRFVAAGGKLLSGPFDIQIRSLRRRRGPVRERPGDAGHEQGPPHHRRQRADHRKSARLTSRRDGPSGPSSGAGWGWRASGHNVLPRLAPYSSC